MSCGMKTPLANCLYQTSSILKQSLCFAPPLLLLLGFIFYASLNFSCYLSLYLSLYRSLSLSLGGLALSQSLLQTQLFRLIVFLCLLLPPVLKRFSSFLFFFFEGCGGLGTLGISPRGAVTAASQTFSSRSTQCCSVENCQAL